MDKINRIGKGYRLLQKDDKLRLVIEPVLHIKDAYEKLMVLKGER